jgi:hypothetical protein
MLVGPADVGGYYFENHSVRGIFAAEGIGLALGHSKLGVGYRLYFDDARTNIGNTPISSHKSSSLQPY